MDDVFARCIYKLKKRQGRLDSSATYLLKKIMIDL